MAKKNDDFSQQISELLKQPEAQALLARLRQMDTNALQQAVNHAMQGNTAKAQEALMPLMQDEEVKKLTQKMRDSNGGI